MPRRWSDPESHPRWSLLVAAQHGILDIAQLKELGASTEWIAAQLAARRWEQPLPRVYATFTGPLPRPSKISAARLYGGAAALLSHRTAAEEWGLVSVTDGPVHITLPYTSSAVSQPDVVVHRSRAYKHIAVAGNPPITSPADTAIDLAVEEPDARQARTVLTDLLTGGRLRLVDVVRRLDERPPRRHRRALAEAVRLVREGVQSVLEELYALEVEQAHGIPAARRQAPVRVDGAVLYEDAVYDHLGVPLTVRLDGRTHLRAGVAFRDRRRDNVAELDGRSRLTYGFHDLSTDPCGAAVEVIAVLRRHGWTGATTHCSRCRVVSAEPC